MMDLDRELWRLGIPAKTRHNEVAPAQFEMAPVYEPTSVGSDHNMVVMSHDAAHRLAARPDVPHPREAVRRHQRVGQAQQLVDGHRRRREPARPGQRPARQRAVPGLPGGRHPRRQRPRRHPAREHRRRRQRPSPRRQRGTAGDRVDLPRRRSSRTSSTSSRRARPRRPRRAASWSSGVTSLPVLAKDATDRNRTSPFAFTGNKFEFRAVGSSAPIYWPQTVLNTAVADSLKQLADELEKLEHGDFEGLTAILSAHRQGQQAGPVRGQRLLGGVACRGRPPRLPNNRTTVDALPALTTDTAKALFSRFGVLSERELASRVEINWERYVKVQDIEASCAVDIASTMILPAAARYLGELAGAPSSRGINTICERVSGLADSLVDAIAALEHAQHAGPRGRVRAGRGEGVRRRRSSPPRRRFARSSTSSRRSSPTTSGRCRSTGSCSSSTERLHAQDARYAQPEPERPGVSLCLDAHRSAHPGR